MSNNSNLNDRDNNIQDNSNIAEGEDKEYDDNYSMNATYEEFETYSNTRLRENDGINLGDNQNTNQRTENLIGNVNITNNTNNTNIIQPNVNIAREGSGSNEFSNLNFNIYSELNQLEADSVTGYGTGNFETNLDEIFDNLTYLITTEKNKLKKEKSNVIKAKQKFLELKQQETLKLEKEKEQWKENIRIADSVNVKESDILDLDIGGTHKITTSRSTLIKYPQSALAAMFSGRFEIAKHNGRLFIDRDGLAFVNMVNYLRNGKFPLFKDRNEEINFFEELDFWQIPINEGKDNFNKSDLQFDPEWCANTLQIEQNNTLIKKHNLQHGIVFCKTPLDAFCPYIEFKVTMNIPCRGKSHLFIGLVDKSKYKYENLVSTFWKDSPSSYYWDVWNTKLIKTDEKGQQVGTNNGYGCLCEEYETNISIKYDHKTRAVSFYKNHINQGVAFKNVPAGLTPSLDIWFESGTVEIIKNTNVQEAIYL